MPRRVLILAALALASGLGGYAVWSRMAPPSVAAAVSPDAGTELPPCAVDVAPATLGEVREVLHALGTLQAQQSVPLASQTGGIVTSIAFTEGKPVEAGEPLIQLDARIAQAQYDAAMGQYRLAQVRLGRSQELSSAGYRSKQTLDDDRTSLESAMSDIAVRRTQLDLLTVRAPFRGVIGQRLVGLGEYVSPGKTLAWLEDRTVLRVNFHVPERYYPRLSIGQPFEAQVDAVPGRVFAGRVAFFDARPDLNDRDIELRGEIANDPPTLTSGLFARISLTIDKRDNVVIVRPSAIRYTLTGAYVFKLDGERVRRVPIRLGVEMPDRVEVLSGVAAGDWLVTVGKSALDDGRRVEVTGRQGGPGA